MPFNGSGAFNPPGASFPAVANTLIESAKFNAVINDIATGLSTCITKDGQTTVTANIPFAGFKLTGVGAGTARTDAANVGNVQDNAICTIASVAGTDTITGSLSPAITAYVKGMTFVLIPANDNTGAATLNLNSVGAKDLKKNTGTAYAALAAGDLQAGQAYVVVFDDASTDQFVVLNPSKPEFASLPSPTITGSPTAAGATWTNLGTVTTADINGGTIDGTPIGATTPTTGAFSTLTTNGNATLGNEATDSHTINGTVSVTAGVLASANSVTPGAGSVSKNATQGLFLHSATGSSYDFTLANVANTLYIIRVPTGTANVEIPNNVTLGDDPARTLTINAETVSQPNIPCFLADNTNPDTDQTGNGATVTVDFSNERFDQSGDFAADTFTAPATGRYRLSFLVTYSDLTTAMSTFVTTLVTSNKSYEIRQNVHVETAGDFWAQALSLEVDMDAADTAHVTGQISGGAGNTADINVATYFSGVRVA